MRMEQRANDLMVWAPAKVNLFLEVLGKRTDGYHEIATLMVAVRLYDTLIFRKESSGGVTLSCSRPDLSTGPENLILRAANLLRQRTGSARSAAIHLVKRIPLAGGLAGGSTDAAATLTALNQLWQLGLAHQELVELSAELGSDVAFFLTPSAAWCTGRGEQVEQLPLSRKLWFVLLCPPLESSTAAVYRQVQVPAQPLSGEAIRAAVRQGDIEQIGRLLHNRLQEAAERISPSLAEYRELLARCQPAGQLLSGSGSTLFALCRGPHEAQRIAQHLRSAAGDAQVYLVQSCA